MQTHGVEPQIIGPFPPIAQAALPGPAVLAAAGATAEAVPHPEEAISAVVADSAEAALPPEAEVLGAGEASEAADKENEALRIQPGNHRRIECQ